jgi:hypothetical protein
MERADGERDEGCVRVLRGGGGGRTFVYLGTFAMFSLGSLGEKEKRGKEDERRDAIITWSVPHMSWGTLNQMYNLLRQTRARFLFSLEVGSSTVLLSSSIPSLFTFFIFWFLAMFLSRRTW